MHLFAVRLSVWCRAVLSQCTGLWWSLVSYPLFHSLYTEKEAKDACVWLKAAGFPQYVQMYEGKIRNCVGC